MSVKCYDLAFAILKLSIVDHKPKVYEIFNKSIEEGYIEMAHYLLKTFKIDPAAGNNSAIQLAVNLGHVNIVKLLLQESRVDQTPPQIITNPLNLQ
ncbi:MAG: hypothetical protein K0S74_619 [Chlamydiales bacterium]|jgi:hypothetical protein|nr:hypothetical protein [Chlamydiales bacterium]